MLVKTFSLFVAAAAGVTWNSVGLAQVEPDSSLGAESSITESVGQNTRITGGAKRSDSLFHSFEEFSIPEGASVFFANPEDVRSIFSRVTGAEASEIFGTLGVEGFASLFFLNPNGVIFGPNAQLAIPGSLYVSTGNELDFDGYVFSAAAPRAVPPILTVNVPVGLGLGSNPGPIEVRGSGRDIFFLANTQFNSPSFPFEPAGIQAGPTGQLALIGGNIIFDGASIDAFAGSVYLLASDSTTVPIRFENGFVFDPEPGSLNRDIDLMNRSSITSSFGGDISVAARNLSLSEGSLILTSSLTPMAPGGDVAINLEGDLTFVQGDRSLLSTLDDAIARPRVIYTRTISDMPAGSIDISAENVTVADFYAIRSTTFGNGQGGDITINARDRLAVIGEPLFPNTFTNASIVATTSVLAANGGTLFIAGLGDSGDVDISGSKLLVTEGGSILTLTVSLGSGQDLTATFDDIILTGRGVVDPSNNSSVSSTLGSVTAGVSPNSAGQVTVRTESLLIDDGAALSSNGSGSGSAGSLDILASSITVTGTSFEEPSKIVSAVEFNNSFFTALFEGFGAPVEPSGRAGTVSIESNNISVSDSAVISTINEGTRSGGGDILIDTDRLSIDNSGFVTATTRSQNGGNISIFDADSIVIANGGITAESLESGNGGSIEIDAETLVLDSSAIIQANAGLGRGGNITISSDAFIQAPDSDIEASGELGLGVIVIDSPETDFLFDLVAPQPELLVERDALLDDNCIVGRDRNTGELIVTANTGNITPPEQVHSDFLQKIEPDEILQMPDGRLLALPYCDGSD